MRWRNRGLWIGALLLLTGLSPAAAQPRFGVDVAPGEAVAVPAPPEPDEDAPRPTGALVARVEVRWAEVETSAGSYDWSETLARCDALSAAGWPLHVALLGPHPLHAGGAPPSPADPAGLRAWLAFVRSAVRAFGSRLDVIEPYAGPDAVYEPAIYAFVIKQSALAARAQAEAAGHEVRVAQGAVAAGSLAWQRALWTQDVAAYVDVLPVRVDGGTDVRAVVGNLFQAALEFPPAPELRMRVDGLGAAVEALSAGADRVLVALPAQEPARSTAVAWLAGSEALLAAEFAPAPAGFAELREPDGTVHGRFLHASDFSTLFAYSSTQTAGQARLRVDDMLVRNGRSVDPVSGRELRTAAIRLEPADGDRARNALRANLAPYPMWIRYEKAALSPGFELPPEELGVGSRRGLTAEEIIAKHQQVQRVQDDRLERWSGRGRVDLHFKLAQGGGSIDVAIASNYFWERDGQLEWEQTDYWVNGNPIRWKSFPEIPLIQPEKVVTLPLDLTLDRSYRYRLQGEDRVGDRDAWVLEFQPENPDTEGSAYRGRVWIDRATFHRLRVALVQTGLDAPVLANEERDLYRPFPFADGGDCWLLAEVDGQQVWSVGGRNFVVRRELTFEAIEVNPDPAEFERRRQAAYASNNRMLRDTDAGHRYLERQPDGSRTVKERMDTNQIFAVGGAFKDSSTDGVTPLAGLGYNDFDVRGSGTQLNAQFAGAFGRFNASKPGLWGTRMDAAVDAVGVAILLEDEVFVNGRESPLETVRKRPYNLTLRLGIPVGSFAKFSLIGGATWRDYAAEQDAAAALDAFNAQNGTALRLLLPEDHLESRGALQFELNRRGYTLTAEASRSWRSDWGAFGLVDGMGNPLEFDGSGYATVAPAPLFDSFTRWNASVFKEWYLPKFQKLRAQVNYLDGNDLDRFSRYGFSFFGDDRLNGFAGSGVRFDQGLIARTGYAFNLFGALRLDAALESAWVERDGASEGRQSHTGFGFSFNTPFKWKTVIAVNWGIAVASDIPELEGEQEFLLLVLKLF